VIPDSVYAYSLRWV